MAVSREKLFIPGVWGPFWSGTHALGLYLSLFDACIKSHSGFSKNNYTVAMVPEYWLTEGGQSATGALLDHIIENHVASPRLANHAASQSKQIFHFFVFHFLLRYHLVECCFS